MRKTRLLLIVISLIGIIGFIGFNIGMRNWKPDMDKVDRPRTDSAEQTLFFLFLGSSLVNMFIVHRYARKTGRQARLWAFASICFPIIIPLVLAIIPEAVSQEDIDSWTLAKDQEIPTGKGQQEADVGRVKEGGLFPAIANPVPVFKLGGIFGSSSWALDKLRLFCIVVTSDVKWRVISTSAERNYIFPDLMSPRDAENEYRMLANRCSGNLLGLVGIELCLADYNDHGCTINLYKLGWATQPLLAGLYRFRAERMKKLHQWLAGNPQVKLKSSDFIAAVDKNGFHHETKSVAWPEIKLIKTTSSGTFTTMTVVPEGRSGGMFDYHSPTLIIPSKKRDLYAAECYFWKTYSA
jgi:hypothetical protein